VHKSPRFCWDCGASERQVQLDEHRYTYPSPYTVHLCASRIACSRRQEAIRADTGREQEVEVIQTVLVNTELW